MIIISILLVDDDDKTRNINDNDDKTRNINDDDDNDDNTSPV